MAVDHARAKRTAEKLAALLGQSGDHELPPDALIRELAHAHLELLRATPLAIYVTAAAAGGYASAVGIDGPEDARRELFELLLAARPKAGDPSRWRLREPEIDARVSVEAEGRVAVITHVHVHDRGAQRYPRTRRGR